MSKREEREGGREIERERGEREIERGGRERRIKETLFLNLNTSSSTQFPWQQLK